MSQSRSLSAIEAAANTILGYALSVAAAAACYAVLEIEVTATQNLTIGLVLMLVSFARSYLIRRAFSRI